MENVGTLNICLVSRIKNQIFERIDIFSKGGEFVFSTIFNMLPDMPLRNIVAMFGAIKGYNN